MDMLEQIAEMKRQIEELQRVAGVNADTVDGHHASDFIVGTDSGWVAVTMLNSWVAYDNAYGRTDNTLIRKIGNVVFIRGLVKTGTLGTVAFTLPSGWRPEIHQIFGSSSIDVFHQVRIQSNGDVIPNTGGGSGWCSISCSFIADQ